MEVAQIRKFCESCDARKKITALIIGAETTPANEVVCLVSTVRHLPPNIQSDAANTRDLNVNQSSAVAEMAAQCCTSRIVQR